MNGGSGALARLSCAPLVHFLHSSFAVLTCGKAPLRLTDFEGILGARSSAAAAALRRRCDSLGAGRAPF